MKTHDDELIDAANELRAADCHRLADAVERARLALYVEAPVQESLLEPDAYEDPVTGQLVLSLVETSHAAQ